MDIAKPPIDPSWPYGDWGEFRSTLSALFGCFRVPKSAGKIGRRAFTSAIQRFAGKVVPLAILCDLFGMVSSRDPFQWLSDLQRRDEKVTA